MHASRTEATTSAGPCELPIAYRDGSLLAVGYRIDPARAQRVIAGLFSIIASIAVQGSGHSLERQEVHAFTGARDFVRRLYAEQFCNFWRFLFSGQWYARLTPC